jgi:biopolymer transport protein ExbD
VVDNEVYSGTSFHRFIEVCRMKPWRPSAALKKRRSKPLSLIEVSGFASIMVFLLALFLVRVSDYRDLPKIAVDLPQSHHGKPLPGANREDALRLNLMRDGMLYLEYERVSMTDLPAVLRERVKNGSERKVYLSIDARARWGDAKAVLNQIRLAGIENVSILTAEEVRLP